MHKLYGAQTWKSVFQSFSQIPVFLSLTYALKQLTDSAFELMKTEGTLWFTDLTQPDITFGLPVIIGCLHLINIEARFYSGIHIIC